MGAVYGKQGILIPPPKPRVLGTSTNTASTTPGILIDNRGKALPRQKPAHDYVKVNGELFPRASMVTDSKSPYYQDFVKQPPKETPKPILESAKTTFLNLKNAVGKVNKKVSDTIGLKEGESLGAPIGRLMQKTPNLDLGSKGQKFFQATDTETKLVNFISNFPSAIAQSWGQTLETLSSKDGRSKLKEDAKKLPNTMSEVKTHIEKGEWQQALEKAVSNSAVSVSLDVADFIPIGTIATKGAKGLAGLRKTAQQAVKEGIEEAEEQAVKTAAKEKITFSEPKSPGEKKAVEYITKNTGQAKQDYFKRVEEKFGTDNVISADEAKYVIPDFKSTNSAQYHEPASTFSKQLYDEELVKRKGSGNNTVLFMSGGTGSGKTSGLKNVGVNLKKYPLVYDTNLTGIDSATKKVQKALDNGYKVEIFYTQRGPVEAFEHGVLPRVKNEGRIVTIDEHIKRHADALETLGELKKKFGEKIDISYIDNTGPKGTAKIVDLDKLPKFIYNRESLEKTLNAKLQEAVNNKTITPEEARAIKGEAPSSMVRGQSEPQRTERQPLETTGTGETKVSKLGLRVEQTAIEKKLTQELGDLPDYKQMSMKDQARMAADLLKSDPDRALRIALGQEQPPNGLLPQSVFKALEGSITTPEMARKLATSPLVSQSSALGQRIKALDVQVSDSPVKAMQDILDARKQAIEKKYKSVDKATKNVVKEIKSKIKAPDKYDWNAFVESIKC